MKLEFDVPGAHIVYKCPECKCDEFEQVDESAFGCCGCGLFFKDFDTLVEMEGNATYNAYIKMMMNKVNRIAVESLTDSDLMDMLDNAGKDEPELEIGVKRINKGGMSGSVCGFNRKKTDE